MEGQGGESGRPCVCHGSGICVYEPHYLGARGRAPGPCAAAWSGTEEQGGPRVMVRTPETTQTDSPADNSQADSGGMSAPHHTEEASE